MKSEEIINIEEFIDKKQDRTIYFDEISNSLNKFNQAPIKLQNFFTDYGLIVFLTKGSFSVTLNNAEWILDANSNCLLFMQPRAITNNFYVNEDLKGYVLGIHREAINDGIMSVKNKILLPWSRMLDIASHSSPLHTLNDEQKTILTNSFEDLKKAYQRVDFKFHNVLTRLKTTELIFELLNILLPKIERLEASTHKVKKVGYKESICNEFLILAMDHHRTQHTLDFYAEKLHISTQYLTHLVKNVHGITANKIINDMIMLDAKAMLRLPTKSIKEIAFELNFADQSSFGKFFKKHTGISASKYRKME